MRGILIPAGTNVFDIPMDAQSKRRRREIMGERLRELRQKGLAKPVKAGHVAVPMAGPKPNIAVRIMSINAEGIATVMPGENVETYEIPAAELFLRYDAEQAFYDAIAIMQGLDPGPPR